MLICQTSDPEWLCKTEEMPIANPKCDGDRDSSVISHRNEPTIERCVQMWSEQKPIKDVETLAVALAVRPRLNVAGPKYFGDSKPGDGAAPFPVFEQSCAEDVLADTLYNEPFSLGRSGKR